MLFSIKKEWAIDTHNITEETEMIILRESQNAFPTKKNPTIVTMHSMIPFSMR